VRQPASAVPGAVANAVSQTAGVVLSLPQRMVAVADAAFGDGERDPTGVVGLVGVGRVAGEIASIDAAQYTTAARVADLLALLAALNVALFVFNLIPLVPLDGGHVAGALWEGLRRQVARLRRRPDPGPVDVARAMPLAYAVVVLMLGMGLVLAYADIVRPITLGG
jgi:membrane-associated protease RseP (regulator of RpoE activity)